MMSRSLIGLMLAIGGATWIYTKMSKQTGGQAKPALIVAGIAALFIFGISFLLLGFLPD